MAEEKQEKNRPGIARRIKWLGLGLLTLLLITALILQAPWKVTTLLLIILLACTVLPKPARKYFWLSAAGSVIALIIWVFLPDDSEGWRPKTFDEELAALEAKYAIPDENNAAIIYNQLLENYDEDAPEPNFTDDGCYDLTYEGPWSRKDHPEIAQWLEGQQGIIATLVEVSKIEKCRFSINADPINLGQSTNRLVATRRWAYLLIRAGNNDIGEGRIDAGLEKYLCVIQMANHQYQQPALIEMLVAMSIEALAIGQFNRFTVAGDATEEHLNVIESALSEIKHDWGSNLPGIFEYEKFLMKNMLSMFYEINQKGKVRLSRDPYAEMRACWKEQLEANSIENQQIRDILISKVYLTYSQKKLIKAKTILYWFYMPSTPQKLARVIDASYEKLYAMAEPDFDWQKEQEEFSITSVKFNFCYMVKFLTNILEPSFYRIHDRYLRVTTDKRSCLLLVGLRRYKNKNGQWPKTLDDIKSLAPAEIFIDPFNNDSFVYKLTDDAFTLYSKGKNNIDEDGKYKRRYGETSEGDDWLIWPPKSRKNKTDDPE